MIDENTYCPYFLVHVFSGVGTIENLKQRPKQKLLEVYKLYLSLAQETFVVWFFCARHCGKDVKVFPKRSYALDGEQFTITGHFDTLWCWCSYNHNSWHLLSAYSFLFAVQKSIYIHINSFNFHKSTLMKALLLSPIYEESAMRKIHQVP